MEEQELADFAVPFGAEKEMELLSAVFSPPGEDMWADGLWSWVRGCWHGLT